MFWIMSLMGISSIFFGGLLFWLEKPGGLYFLLLSLFLGLYSFAAFLVTEDRHEKK